MWRWGHTLVFVFLLFFVSCSSLRVTSKIGKCHILCGKNNRCRTTHIGNTCYVKFKGEMKTWYDTQKWCQEQNMTMVNLPEELEVSLISKLPKIIGKNYIWLGGRAIDLGKWTYAEGNPLYIGEFSWFNHTTYFHGCGALRQAGPHHTHLGLRSCFDELPYICRSGISIYRGIYQPMTNRKNWFGARQICRDTGGDLLYAKKDETLEGLLSNFTKSQMAQVAEDFFIGLRHQIWKWQDGNEITNSNWNSKQPISKEYEHYCVMFVDGKLHAEGCFENGKVICQKELPKTTDNSPTMQMTLTTDNSPTMQMTLTTESPTLVQEGEHVSVSYGTFSGFDKIIRSSTTTGYFTALAFFGGSLLLLAVAFPLILCWMKRQKKEANEVEDHIYCEVTLERIPSRTGPRHRERRRHITSTTQECSHQNIEVSEEVLDAPNPSLRTPFSRTSADDVVIMDNHLYGSTEEIIEECRQRSFKTAMPQNPGMSEETGPAENHLCMISEVPAEERDTNQASSDKSNADRDRNEACN